MAYRFTKQLLGAAAAFALLAGPALAADDTSSKSSTAGTERNAATGGQGSKTVQGGKNTASPELKDTLARIHMANAMEIEAGRIAQDRAQDDKVKDYAKKMVDDHSEADERVTKIAEKNGISLADPKASDKHKQAHIQQLDKLKKMEGAQFDHAYMGMMAKDHQHVLKELKTAQQTVKNEDLKALLGDLVPKVEEHARMAQQLHASAGHGADARQGRHGSDQATRHGQGGSSDHSAAGHTQGGGSAAGSTGSRNTDQGSGATDDIPGGTSTGQTGDTGHGGSGSGGGGK
jgi:putative membrane protein